MTALRMREHTEKRIFSYKDNYNIIINVGLLRQLVQSFECIRKWGQGTERPEFLMFPYLHKETLQ